MSMQLSASGSCSVFPLVVMGIVFATATVILSFYQRHHRHHHHYHYHQDLGLLFSLVFMGMLVFGSLAFYIENGEEDTGFYSIPQVFDLIQWFGDDVVFCGHWQDKLWLSKTMRTCRLGSHISKSINYLSPGYVVGSADIDKCGLRRLYLHHSPW